MLPITIITTITITTITITIHITTTRTLARLSRWVLAMPAAKSNHGSTRVKSSNFSSMVLVSSSSPSVFGPASPDFSTLHLSARGEASPRELLRRALRARHAAASRGDSVHLHAKK